MCGKHSSLRGCLSVLFIHPFIHSVTGGHNQQLMPVCAKSQGGGAVGWGGVRIGYSEAIWGGFTRKE